MSHDLAAGYLDCARLTRAYGTTYYWGAVLLPPEQRRHVHAVYALCRLADDIVDAENATTTHVEQTRAALADFRAGFDAALAAGRRRPRSRRSPPPWPSAPSTPNASTASSTRWRWTEHSQLRHVG